MSKRYLYGLVGLWLLVLACQSPGRPEENRAAPDSAEETYLETWADEAATGLELGRYAAGKASDQRLKTYGLRLRDFYRRASDSITLLLQRRGMALPDTLTAEGLQLVGEMAAKAGNDFDSSFMAVMAEQQKQLISSCDDAIKELKNKDMQEFALVFRDSLLRHLDRIITIKDSIYLRKPH